MVKKKTKSKREGLKQKYMIQRHVKEHNSKAKKLAKARASAGLAKRTKRDPGVPNLFPLKARILAQAERKMEAQAEFDVAQKNKRRAAVEKRRREKLLEIGRSEQMYHEISEKALEKRMNETDVSKRRWYFKELNKTIEQSDVLLMVLDARDPMGCRCLEIEQKIISQTTMDGENKKLLLVLNKIDLVPKEIVEKWLTFLKREYPTIAFKASTQKQKQISQVKVDVDKAQELQVAGCIGGDALLQLLKNYSRSLDRKKAITVGVVGYPNTGKSSVINSLTRKWAAGVGAQPGFTKQVTQIKLDKLINLLDSPGVLFANQSDDKDLVLRNCLKLEDVENVVEAAHRIVEKVSPATLMQLYSTAAFETAHDFLRLVAQRRGKLGKGGVPNLEMAARAVLKDWNEGAIPFYTVPPKMEDAVGEAVVVGGWGKKFDIDAFLEQENSSAMNSRGDDVSMMPHATVVASSGPQTLPSIVIDEQGGGGMSDDDDTRSMATSRGGVSGVRSMAPGTKKNKRRLLAAAGGMDDEEQMPGTSDPGDAGEQALRASLAPLQRNKQLKKSRKKQEKEKRRAERAGAGAGDAAPMFLTTEEADDL